MYRKFENRDPILLHLRSCSARVQVHKVKVEGAHMSYEHSQEGCTSLNFQLQTDATRLFFTCIHLHVQERNANSYSILPTLLVVVYNVYGIV